jgi:SAM-dependent methyltransferase
MRMGVEARVGQRRKWEQFWDAPILVTNATHLLAAQLVLEMLRTEGYPARSLRVLDLGCGTGNVLALFERAGCRTVGTDLAAGALRAARGALGPGARLVQSDAYNQGIRADSFDAVVSLGYASVGSYQGVQGEIARVLRPGGVALIDFRRFGLYHVPLVPVRMRQMVDAWRRGQASLPCLGLRPVASWAATGLRLEETRLFNCFPPLGRRTPDAIALALERRIGRSLAPMCARTVVAKFRKVAA